MVFLSELDDLEETLLSKPTPKVSESDELADTLVSRAERGSPKDISKAEPSASKSPAEASPLQDKDVMTLHVTSLGGELWSITLDSDSMIADLKAKVQVAS